MLLLLPFFLEIRYFCKIDGLCPFSMFVSVMESIIQTDKFRSLTPDLAILLIKYHHCHHTMKGFKSKPLVLLFVDEARILAEYYATRPRPSGSISEAVLKSEELSAHNCQPLIDTFSAIGSCLSCIKDFHCLITSLENSSLLKVGAFFRFYFLFTASDCS